MVNYTVITGSGACTTTATYAYTFCTTPTPTIVASSLSVECGQSVTLTATGSTSYTWSTGVISNTVSVMPLVISIYTVSVGSNNCISTETISITQLPPNVSVTVTADKTTIIEGTQVQLTLSVTGNTYTWSPTESLSCTTCTNPIASPSITTLYCAETGTTPCTVKDCILIDVEVNCYSNKQYSVPNAFSPNGDGINDEFCLQGWLGCVISFEIAIFDRWGEIVFKSNNESFCWDGIKNSRKLDPAVFIYYINAEIINQGKLTKKGNITLLR